MTEHRKFIVDQLILGVAVFEIAKALAESDAEIIVGVLQEIGGSALVRLPLIEAISRVQKSLQEEAREAAKADKLANARLGIGGNKPPKEAPTIRKGRVDGCLAPELSQARVDSIKKNALNTIITPLGKLLGQCTKEDFYQIECIFVGRMAENKRDLKINRRNAAVYGALHTEMPPVGVYEDVGDEAHYEGIVAAMENVPEELV